MGRPLYIVGFFVLLSVILLLGLRSEPVPQVFDHQDWLHHALAFGSLVGMSRLAFPRIHGFWIMLYCLAIGVMIELFQGLLPLRSPSLGDMGANAVGIALGFAGAELVQRAWHSYSENRSRSGSRSA